MNKQAFVFTLACFFRTIQYNFYIYIMKLNSLKHFLFILLFTGFSSIAYSQGNSLDNIHSKIEYRDSANELIELAKTNYVKGNLTNAIVFSFDAMNILDEVDAPELLFELYTTIGNVYSVLEDYEKTYFYFKQDDNIANILNQDKLKLISKNNFTKFYIELELIDSAEKYLNNALKYYDQKNSEPYLSQIFYNQAQIFKQNGNYKSAISYYQKSIIECINNNNELLLLENYIAISEVQLIIENFKEAEIDINKCLLILNKTPLLFEFKVYELLSLLYESKGLYKESLTYHQKYILIKDTVLNSPKTKNVAKLYTSIKIHNQKDKLLDLSNSIIDQSDKIEKQTKLKNIPFFIVFKILPNLLVLHF